MSIINVALLTTILTVAHIVIQVFFTPGAPVKGVRVPLKGG